MLSFLITGVQAFADHGKDKGPCKAEFASCKGNKDFHKCVSDAATANNNAACTEHLAKEKDHHGHHGKKGAAPATPAAGQ